MRLLRHVTGSTLALALFAGAAAAEDLKFANFMAPTNPYEEGAFKPFANKVAEATGGNPCGSTPAASSVPVQPSSTRARLTVSPTS